MVSTLVSVSHFFAVNREAEVKCTTFSSLLLFHENTEEKERDRDTEGETTPSQAIDAHIGGEEQRRK